MKSSLAVGSLAARPTDSCRGWARRGNAAVDRGPGGKAVADIVAFVESASERHTDVVTKVNEVNAGD